MKIVLPLLACLLFSACAPAGTPGKPGATPTSSAATPAPTASVVQRALAADGIDITGSMDAPPGYTGFLASYRGRELPVYALPDGKHLMVGTLFDLEGKDLTSPEMAKAASSGFGELQWKALADSAYVVEGNPNAERIVYAFVDTRCPYCHKLWQATQPILKQGKVQIRDVLVGVIAPESLPEAANILAAKDPAAAWNRNEQNFGKNPAPAVDHLSPDAMARVRANTALMRRMGIMGTPGIVWKDAQGQVHATQGMPQDPKELAAIFGG